MSVELKVYLFIWSHNFWFSMSLSLSPNSLYRQTTDCTEGGGLTREHYIINPLSLHAILNFQFFFRYISLHSVTFRYIRLHFATFGYISLRSVTFRYVRLLFVTFGYISLHSVTFRYIRLHFATFGYISLHSVAFRFASISLVSFRFVWFRFVRFRFVSILLRTLQVPKFTNLVDFLLTSNTVMILLQLHPNQKLWCHVHSCYL
jgi:hypothetical protein